MRRKFSEVQIKRSIIRNIPKTTHSNVIKAGIGCDYARLLLHVGNKADCWIDEVAVAEGVCMIETIADIRYAFIKLYNNLRVGGYVPFAMTDSMLMPSDDERYMKRILISLTATAGIYGLDIITGHTEISDAVNKSIVTMTMIGGRKTGGKSDNVDKPTEGMVAEETVSVDVMSDNILRGASVSLSPENIKSGMDIVMCGQTGVMGTVKLLKKYREGLLTRYSKTYLSDAEKLNDYMAIGNEVDIAIEEGICYSHDISTGGVYAALWEMADAADVGIDICHDAIPILQETIEICEYTDHNPYMIDGSGAVLFVTEHGSALSDRLYAAGYEAAVIGRVTEGKDRTITHEDEKRFLTPPKYDEI